MNIIVRAIALALAGLSFSWVSLISVPPVIPDQTDLDTLADTTLQADRSLAGSIAQANTPDATADDLLSRRRQHEITNFVGEPGSLFPRVIDPTPTPAPIAPANPLPANPAVPNPVVPAPTLDPSPNVVIINLDDARADVMEVLPSVERWFGDEGVTFNNAYVTTPSCCPSRATLMTGQLVHNNGQVDQNTPLTDESTSIQRYLSDSGYFTGHVGKYLHYYDLDEQAPYWDRWAYYRGGYIDVPFFIDGEFNRAEQHSTIETFDLAIDQLESFEQRDDDRPFYLHIAPVAPHRPLIPEEQYANAPVPEWDPSPAVFEANRSDKPPWVSFLSVTPEEGEEFRTGQLRLLMSVDDQVDRFMRRLTALGEADNTIAIFTSDNGVFWGEHGRNSKFLPYNEAIEVPFLVRWPGQLDAGSVRDDFITHPDILPTVLSAVEVDWAHRIDGRNIFDPGFSRDNVFTEYFFDVDNNNGIPDWSSIRNEDRVYTEYYDEAGAVIFEEYYDLQSDRFELVNLLGNAATFDDPDVTADRQLLRSARNCSGSSCQ